MSDPQFNRNDRDAKSMFGFLDEEAANIARPGGRRSADRQNGEREAPAVGRARNGDVNGASSSGARRSLPIIRRPVPVSESGPLRAPGARIVDERDDDDFGFLTEGPETALRIDPSRERPDPRLEMPVGASAEGGEKLRRSAMLFGLFLLCSGMVMVIYDYWPVLGVSGLVAQFTSRDKGLARTDETSGNLGGDATADAVAATNASDLSRRFAQEMERLESLLAANRLDEVDQALGEMDRTVYGYGFAEFSAFESRVAAIRAGGEVADVDEVERAEAARVAEAERVAAEEARIAEAERVAEEARVAEAERLAEEARVAEAERVAEEARVAEAERVAEEARVAEAERLAEEARVAEAERVAEEARVAEAERVAEEARVAEAERVAEEARVAEAERVAEEARVAEAARVAVEEARVAEAERVAAEEARVAEAERVAAEVARVAEAERVAAEEARVAEAERVAAEEARVAEAELAAEEARVAEVASAADPSGGRGQADADSRRSADRAATDALVRNTGRASTGSTEAGGENPADRTREATRQAARERAAEIEREAAARAALDSTDVGGGTQRDADRRATTVMADRAATDRQVAAARLAENASQGDSPDAGSDDVRVASRPEVGDEDFELIYGRFKALERAVEQRDIQTVISLTRPSGARIQQLLQVFENSEALDARITNVSMRKADEEISGILRIDSIRRADGSRIRPPPGLEAVSLTSSRDSSGWSALIW